jgi:hypothetical protein
VEAMIKGITNQQAIDELLAFAAKAVSERYYKLVYVDSMGWIFECNDGTRSNWFDPSVNNSDCLLLSTKSLEIAEYFILCQPDNMRSILGRLSSAETIIKSSASIASIMAEIRSKFEAWAVQQAYFGYEAADKTMFERDGEGYTDAAVHAAWMGWVARS